MQERFQYEKPRTEIRNSNIIGERLLLKRKLLQQGDPAHKEIKTALLVGGGGMKGVYSAGALLELELKGFGDVFDLVVGVSAGAANCAYFLAGQGQEGLDIYRDLALSKSFIKPSRLNKIMGVDYMGEVMREHVPLDQQKIKASRSDFYIGVSAASTGNGKLIDGKSLSDVVVGLQASCALPIAYNKTVEIDGVDYADGQIGNGLPLQFAIDQGCTDIFVVLNSPIPQDEIAKQSRVESALARLYMRNYSPEFKKALLTRGEVYRKSFVVETEGVNIGIIAPEKSLPVGKATRDIGKLARAVQAGRNEAVNLFIPEPVVLVA